MLHLVDNHRPYQPLGTKPDPAGAAGWPSEWSQVEHADAAAGAASRASQCAQSDCSHDVAIGDLEDLLSAVTVRLAGVGDTWAAHGSEPCPQALATRCHGELLECVTALQQLRTTLAHESGNRDALAREIAEARQSLAQARAELAGTQLEERRARYRSLHDSLTSLPNQAYFKTRLAHSLALAAPNRQTLTVLYLDLDGFKAINDAHGHPTGDELLKVIAARLARVVRAEDMVSRLGGDEFGCLLAGLPDRAQLTTLINKVYEAIAAPCRIGAHKLSVCPSIGVATCPQDGASADMLVRNADAAMYWAKRGRSRYAFFDELVGA